MKVSGKGILIILLFLVVIPVMIELVIMTLLPKNAPGSFSMAKPLLLGYGRFIPLYLIYVAIAFAMMYLIKNWKKITDQK